MNIVTKTVDELTQAEYRACYMANYRDSGYMREELRNSREQPEKYPGTAIMLWDGPTDSQANLLGWCLLSPVRTWGLIAGSRYTKAKAKYTAQFWIKRPHRRKGYGKVLMAEVKKYDERPHVFPHSEASAELFSSYNVTVQQVDRSWLKPGKQKVA